MLSPTTLLVLINCLPIYFAVVWHWDAGELIRVYWAENLVIGFYYILKLVCVKVDPPQANIGKLLIVPFFLLHFGGFCAVHGVFVFALTSGPDGIGPIMSGTSLDPWWGPFVFVGLLINVVRYFFEKASPDELFMVKALFVSHGFSFYMSFIRSGEWKRVGPRALMAAPYQRIVLLHVVLLFGALPVMYFKSPMPLVVMLVVIKIILDMKLHNASHKKIQGGQEAAPRP